MTHQNWSDLASRILKAELKLKDISYEKLVILLEQINIKETKASIVNKMSRGTFQFAFFLQCAAVIGIKNLRLDEIL
ncbi:MULTISPECIES: DUF6471 domain-containing protein [Legionella]|uniref:DUF6471 domain-containing protein n=1 Tax=Legionella drozanskii LLAP-1 TaxID=1212489 RepID=A0A0W0SN02_9GAMM|nr:MULTISPECIES: DUF6471 domain-containing protein [Legionella]KTC84791.1 hypothetical protein Ldro_2955 [Legionella drozanskii LLAP-1]PJE06436.1 MAG: hypothetical protein CK430_14940 [Legionella sp.]